MNEIYDLAIIGAGPAGIALAAEAFHSGIESEKILLLEKESSHSYSIRKFYPDKKLVTANYKGNASSCEGILCIPDLSKTQTLEYLDDVIAQYDLSIKYNENVFGLEKGRHFFHIKTTSGIYKAHSCVVAIGVLGRPNRPSYPIPADLKTKVTFDITSVPIFDKNVLVVGGGDSASEYVQYLVEQGNKVTLSYRRENFSRMLDHNLDALYALEKNNLIQILYKSNVKELRNQDGPLVVFEEEQLGEKSYDHVVLALGGTTPKNFLQLLGIKFKDNWPILDHNYQTNIPGLFLAGDLASGPKGGSIITAFNSAATIMEYLNSSQLIPHHAQEDLCRESLY